MKSLILLLLFYPFLSFASNPETPPQNLSQSKIQYQCAKKVSEDIVITSWLFGMRQKTRLGAYDYIPVKEVPLKPGQEYGFQVSFTSHKKPIHWKYEYELPLPYPNWSKLLKNPKFKVSPDEKMVTVSSVIQDTKGSLEEFWFFFRR